MAETTTHRDLIAWKEAMTLVEMIYAGSAPFPKEELYGLSAQMRRAAVSVPSNIAEGAARNSSRELVQFLGIAHGSLAELETLLELAIRLGYIRAGSECIRQVSRVGKLLVCLRNSIRMKAD
jgi:four helix bundle protein